MSHNAHKRSDKRQAERAAEHRRREKEQREIQRKHDRELLEPTRTNEQSPGARPAGRAAGVTAREAECGDGQ